MPRKRTQNREMTQVSQENILSTKRPRENKDNAQNDDLPAKRTRKPTAKKSQIDELTQVSATMANTKDIHTVMRMVQNILRNNTTPNSTQQVSASEYGDSDDEDHMESDDQDDANRQLEIDMSNSGQMSKTMIPISEFTAITGPRRRQDMHPPSSESQVQMSSVQTLQDSRSLPLSLSSLPSSPLPPSEYDPSSSLDLFGQSEIISGSSQTEENTLEHHDHFDTASIVPKTPGTRQPWRIALPLVADMKHIGKPKESEWDSSIAPLIRHAQAELWLRMALQDMWPDLYIQAIMADEAWEAALVNSNLKMPNYELSQRMMSLLKNRRCNFRQDLVVDARYAVTNIYGFDTSGTSQAVLKNTALFTSLTTNARWLFKDVSETGVRKGFCEMDIIPEIIYRLLFEGWNKSKSTKARLGVLFPSALNPIPKALLAGILTAVSHVIYEWSTGTQVKAHFEEHGRAGSLVKTNMVRYAEFVKEIQQWEDIAPHKVTAKRRRWYVDARARAGVDSIPVEPAPSTEPAGNLSVDLWNDVRAELESSDMDDELQSRPWV